MKIIIDDKIPFIRNVFEDVANVVYCAGAKVTPEMVKDADAIITRTRTRCNAELLQGSAVKCIATATIGFDHIDTEYCEQNGIQWSNAPGCNSGSVAQYIASTLLSLAINEKISLEGKVLGIIGVGNVGKKVARVGRALGMKVLLNDPPRERQEGASKFTDLETVNKTADFITCHTPLNRGGEDDTFHLVDSKFLEQMKATAFLINSSRGEVVDNNALKEALKTKSIAGAVLDVWENEPAIDLELLTLLHYATPHIAGYSADGKANGTMMSVQTVSKYFNLGLDDWMPKSVPLPENTVIDCSRKGLSNEQLLYKAVTQTYDIQQDSLLLMSSPETFEKQRGDYPLRREPGVFSVINAPVELHNSLKELLFNIVE